MKRHPCDYFSASRAFADIKNIYAHARWLTTPRIEKAAHYIARILRRVPQLTEVAIHNYPADGKTAYGGWVMSKAWDVASATLEIASPGVKDVVLADYRKNPHSLINWSPPTPWRGISGEVAVLEKPFEFAGSLAGKFALTNNAGAVSNELVGWLAKRGAIGLLCDQMNWVPGVKEEHDLSGATQWFNYANPQWDGAPRLPAFALTPEGGRRLRVLTLLSPVRLCARVDAKLYDGQVPLVTAFLPGTSGDEIVLTAHMDEPGASDNASGTAMCMELLRAFAAFSAARKKPLQRGIRFFASVEARGLQAFLNTTKYGRQVVAGLNIDMIGYDHTQGRTLLKILAAAPHTSSYVDALLEELADAESKRAPAFRCKIERGVAVDDTHFSSLPFSAPMCMVGQWPDRTYHTSVDRPENLSRAHLQRMGHMLGEAVRFMADANPADVQDFAARVYKKASHSIAKSLKRVMPSAEKPNGPTPRELVMRAQSVLSGLPRLIPDGLACPDEADVRRLRRQKKLVLGHLYARASLDQRIAQWNAALAGSVPRIQSELPPPSASRATLAAATKLIPRKMFAGYIAFEDLNERERKRLRRETGIAFGWAAPGWLQWALDLANGKRSVLDIFRVLQQQRQNVDLAALVAAMRFLERRGQVKFRAYLSARDLSAALRGLGIRRGDTIMAHTSLSEFGYMEGGATTVIDCLLAAVGPRGTLAIPAHSLSWVGNPPYDAKRSPSLVGAVTRAFLKRKGVVRSAHPTHSVAVLGPLARALVAGHDASVAPQSRAGFWGNIVAASGKVVLLCRPDSNTLLHSGELWADSPFPPARVHFMRGGKRVEATTTGMPWHVNSFAAVHAALKRKKQMRSARLGEGLVHSLVAKDGVEEMMKQVRRDPYVVLRPNCKCRWCVYVRGELDAR